MGGEISGASQVGVQQKQLYSNLQTPCVFGNEKVMGLIKSTYYSIILEKSFIYPLGPEFTLIE